MAPLIRVVERLIAPIKRRVLLMVGRAVVRLVDDGPDRQLVQVVALDGEVLDRVERCQEYGLSSCPPPGSEAVLLSCGGMRQHPLVVSVEATEHRARGEGECGEVLIYTFMDRRAAGGVERHRIYLSGESSARLIRLVSRGGDGRQARIDLRSGAGGPSVTIRAAEDGISLTADSLTLSRGRSSIVLTDDGITMRAPRIDRIRAA